MWQGMVLGAVQGLTEFLPVSSSGHLVLLVRWLGIGSDNLFLTAMLHLGTLIAVLAVFREDVWRLLRRPFCDEGKAVLTATFVTGVIYLGMEDLVETSFGGEYLWAGFLLTAILLWISSFIEERSQPLSLRHSALMGLMQGIALFPGVSRSGSTICGGLLGGLDKEQAARLSFLMSIPAILAGTVKEAGEVSFNAVPWGAVIVGTLSSALFGYIAIRFMLRIIQEKKLYWFSLYLLVAAAASGCLGAF